MLEFDRWPKICRAPRMALLTRVLRHPNTLRQRQLSAGKQDIDYKVYFSWKSAALAVLEQ
jgi:hypothetical protein